MDSKNKKSNRLVRHVAEKKAKVQSRLEASIKELSDTCRKLRCDRPIYFLENGKICISLAGSYAFSNAPIFKSRNKIINVEKTRLDVTQQALRWIEHNPPPPYYWKDGEAENTLVDLFSELALGVYENDTRREEVQKAMLHLEGKIMAKLCKRVKSKKSTELDPAKYERALDICRFSRLANRTIIGGLAIDEVSRALSKADTVYTVSGLRVFKSTLTDKYDKDQSQQTEAGLSYQLHSNNATTSVPSTTAVSTNDGTNESVYGDQVAADVNEPVSESDTSAPDNLDESASDPDTCTRGFILRSSVIESWLPGVSMETVLEWMSGSFYNYCHYHDDRDRMQMVSTILSKDGDSLMAKLKELGTSVPVKNVKLIELVLQPHGPEVVERLWGSVVRQNDKHPGAHDLEQFLNLYDGGLLSICGEISKELQGSAKLFLDQFLNWHRNGMLDRILSLAAHVGDRTQEFIDRLLKLQDTKLLPLIDAVIAETDGKPVPLLESFLRWNKNNVAQRFLDFDARGEMNLTSFVEAALDIGKWNILAYVRSLVFEAEFYGKPDVFFRQLRKWQNNKSLQYLHIFDQITSDRSPEFLDLALKMCKTGVWKHIIENRELIGDLPRCFFNDMFGVSRMIVNGEAVVVARGEHGNFTRDLTPNLRPRLLSTSLTSKLQGLPAWMDSICGTGNSTDPSKLEFENTGSNELAKFIDFSLNLYRWGVHSWASNNLDFIGTDPVLFFNELFHLAAVLKNGPASPVVLEAIEATQKIMTGTPVPAATGEIDAGTLSNQTSAVASPPSDMVSQSLLPPPKPASTFDWQRALTGSNSSAPPKTASTYKWQSSYTGPKSSAPSGSSSARKAKKTDTTLPDPADSIEPTILARGKCFKCPRQGTKIRPDGKILCVECRTKRS
ncbi:hypothetical protein BTUL_0009g01070 [Botrytis tulipae]|uniref:Uncharacterized protein n=1 Tax=Botrytis tulipae TaxID=87230 RepID=A0A4Z1FAY7_9HELO|nr:hypothetical protein BTUL_0009g01070 [Botrytis tulipae]